MSWVDNTYLAPEALIDGQGRQFMWAWQTDNPPGKSRKAGPACMVCPRSFWLGEDGTLWLRPVREFEKLHSHKESWSAMTLADEETRVFEGVTGHSFELQLEIAVGSARRCGAQVRAAPDRQEEMLLYFDAEANQLVFDSSRSGTVGRKVVERAPLTLAKGESLQVRVFVDKSVVGVFANDRQAVGRRVYPTHEDSVGVVLFTAGGDTQLRSTKAWEIMPSNPF